MRQADEDKVWSSKSFPSRFIQDAGVKEAAILIGVIPTDDKFDDDLRKREVRFLWRIVPDPEDPTPSSFIVIPISRPVIFTFSHGSSSLVSLAVGGVDIELTFTRENKTLSSSWFTPPFSSQWYSWEFQDS